MEISGAVPLSARPAFAVAAPDPSLSQAQKVAPKTDAQDARTDTRDRSDQDSHAAAVRDLKALKQDVAQGKRPAGPPPSFEVSLLEVEADLKQKLARMEAERAQARESDAVQSAAEAEAASQRAAAAKAEAARAESAADAKEAENTEGSARAVDAGPSPEGIEARTASYAADPANS